MNFTTPLEMTGDTLGCQIKKGWELLSSSTALWVPWEEGTWEASSVGEESCGDLRKADYEAEDRVRGEGRAGWKRHCWVNHLQLWCKESKPIQDVLKCCLESYPDHSESASSLCKNMESKREVAVLSLEDSLTLQRRYVPIVLVSVWTLVSSCISFSWWLFAEFISGTKMRTVWHAGVQVIASLGLGVEMRGSLWRMACGYSPLQSPFNFCTSKPETSQ